MSTVRLLPLTAPVAAGFIIAGNGIAFLATIAILLLTLLAIREVGRHLEDRHS